MMIYIFYSQPQSQLLHSILIYLKSSSIRLLSREVELFRKFPYTFQVYINVIKVRRGIHFVGSNSEQLLPLK